MAEAVRVGAMLRACLEILREADKPLEAGEVMAEVGRRLQPTDYESEPDRRGIPRWQGHLRWYTGDTATVGWMTKREGWAITEAGRAALDAYSGDDLLSEMRRRVAEIRKVRRRASEQLSGYEKTISRALSVVEPGSWTAYEDLAEIAGVSSDTIAHFLAHSPVGPDDSHRAANADGSLPPDGMLHYRFRGIDLREQLRSEGVTFDEHGRASQDQRVTAAQLEASLAELPWDEEPETSGPQAWLVRGSSVDGRDMIPYWLEKGSVSLSGANLPALTLPISREQLKRLVERGYERKSYAVRESRVNEFDAFCNRISPGDYVLTTSQGRTYIGRVTGEAAYVPSPDQRSNLRRTVQWLNPHKPVAFNRLPQPLPAKLHSQSDVVELTENLDEIRSLLSDLDVEVEEEPAPPPDKELEFRPIDDDLAAELCIDRHWLEQQKDLLWRRKHVILYGPPGTGKTYLAQKLALHLTGEPSAVKLVQFHPSYSYEDFFHGLRPVKGDDGQLSYELRHGPFRKFVDAARQDLSTPYILIIDEINRANIAKVFGELYFLLEYRNASVDLLYSGETDFSLPQNIFLIGTMNTSDRSIAFLDAAMRRRFAFVELHPQQPPVSGLLDAWLRKLREGGEDTYAHNLDAPRLLELLNRRIPDYDMAVGPSYLMDDLIYQQAGVLEQVWATSILPLLADHHYDEGRERLHEYRLEALRSALAEAGQE